MFMEFVKALKRCTAVSSIRIIMNTRWLCGYYFEFSRNKFVSIAGKVYALSWGSLVCITFIPHNVYEQSNGFILNTIGYHIEHYAYILVCIITGQKYFFDFCENIQAVDVDLPEIRHESPIAMVMFIVVWSYDIFYALARDNHNVLIRNLILTTTNICIFPNIIIFELLYYRIKSLRKILEEKLKQTCLVNDEPEGIGGHTVRKYMEIYKRIVEASEQATNNNAFKIMMLLSFVLRFYRVLIFCHQVFLFTSNFFTNTMFFYMAKLFIIVTIPFTTAFLAEGITGELDKMKLMLSKKLISCEDNKFKEILEDSLKYFELHPIKVTILRAFTLETASFLKFISLATCYAIVVIQFAHIIT